MSEFDMLNPRIMRHKTKTQKVRSALSEGEAGRGSARAASARKLRSIPQRIRVAYNPFVRKVVLALSCLLPCVLARAEDSLEYLVALSDSE